MQIHLKAVIIHFFAASILLCVFFFGCSDAPRVRLVKDDDETFHFQFAEPLKEERIILVRYNGVLFDHQHQIPWEKEMLVFFPAGTVVSAPVYRQDKRYTFPERIDTVEIRPADLRETALPAELYEIRARHFRYRGERILREHPFFRDYSVDPQSQITFPTLERTDEKGAQSKQ